MLNSPLRLTAVIVVGCLLAASGFLGISSHHVPHSLPLRSACLVAIIIGMVGLYWGSSTLRNDVQNERWTTETIEPFRAVTQHLAWRLVMLLLVTLMFLSLLSRSNQHQYFWIVFLVLQMQTQLGNAFNQPLPQLDPGTRIAWLEGAPLHSDHWGQR